MSDLNPLIHVPRDLPPTQFDPESDLVRLDGSPYHAAAVAGLFYKNPMWLIGSALGFLGLAVHTFISEPPHTVFDYTKILFKLAVVVPVGSMLMPLVFEKAAFHKYPDLEQSLIDKSGLSSPNPEFSSQTQNTYKRAQKTGLIAGVTMLVALWGFDSQDVGYSFAFASPPLCVFLWSSWAKDRLMRNKWIVTTRPPDSDSGPRARRRERRRSTKPGWVVTFG